MVTATKRLYIDVCAFCRVFDDQSVLRIRLETIAMNLILERIRRGDYNLIVSPVHYAEIIAMADHNESRHVLGFLEEYGSKPGWDRDKIRRRADALVQMSFGPADAAHVAFAEESRSCFISCDDVLLKKCRKKIAGLEAMGPVEFMAREGLK